MEQCPFHVAAFHGHAGIVKILVENGADVNSPNKSSLTALPAAAENSSVEALRELLKYGSLSTSVTVNCEVPIHWSSVAGHLRLTQLLLENGTDPNITNNFGSTPVLMTSLGWHGEMVQLLLDNGGDASLAAENGLTPLSEACRTGEVALVKLLLDTNVNVNAVLTEALLTPLSAA